MATEETTITELELAEEVLADMVIPVDTSTDTKSVSLKQLRAWLGSSLPTGFILPAVGRIDDERFSLLDGKTLSKQGTYGAFCAKVEEQVQASNWYACTEEEYNADLLAYGQCGKFVIGTDYVRIPTITRFIGATITLSEIGKTYKESLPNIKGTLDLGSGYNTLRTDSSAYNARGAISVIKGSGNNGASSSGYGLQGFTLDASRSSSTYQDGAKVQPDHTKYPYYMVVSTEGQTASVEIDINKVYEDLNIKANTSLSNVDSNIDYVVEKYVGGNGNWYIRFKSGLTFQGIYASVANGVVNLLVDMTTNNYGVVCTTQIDSAGYVGGIYGKTTSSFKSNYTRDTYANNTARDAFFLVGGF